MTCSPGQELALKQIEQIAAAQSSPLEICSVEDPVTAGADLLVDIKIFCDKYERTIDGLPLRKKEHFCLSVPAGFPFEYPSVDVPHPRFSGFPHVQWRRHLCLYVAPDVEWNPSDGMFGFMQRLDLWLEHGARNELDPIGGPLHPPAIYPKTSRVVVPIADTPNVGNTNWFGFSNLKKASELRFDLDCWYELLDRDIPVSAVPAILLSKPFPFEYPRTVRATIDELDKVGVNRELLMLCLQMGAARTPDDHPMYIVIGTPMRGTGGVENDRKQHLAVWEIEALAVARLKLIIASQNLLERANQENIDALQELAGVVRDGFDDWSNSASMSWCRVMEARNEIVERRDGLSPVHWFAGKKVAIWGCGALGGQVAESIVRAGVRSVVLRDHDCVTPGVLQRQNFIDRQIGYTKSSALRNRLLDICPSLEVEDYSENIVSNTLKSSDWFDGADIVIDATASNLVSARLEVTQRRSDAPVIIVSMAINATADCGLLALCMPSYSGGPYDVFRRAGNSVKNRDHLSAFSDEFWPQGEKAELFQPEPGCSSPTFRGSNSDVASLASLMINQVARDLLEEDSCWDARGHLIPAIPSYPDRQSFSYRSDHVINIPDADLDVRISEGAWRDLNGWIARSERMVGADIETGGLLFGELDEAVNVLWVSEVLGPPPDSRASETMFECGVMGTRKENQEKKKRSGGTISYVGTWHTHPVSIPDPSQTDFEGMAQILFEQGLSASRQLLLIAGFTKSNTEVGAHIFNAASFNLGVNINIAEIQYQSGHAILEPPYLPSSTLGLSLSGGGVRAIAFQLGCLRALNDLGLLSTVKVISGVSGGSVMTALYAYEDDEFKEFDERVKKFLRTGLVRPVLKKFFLSPFVFKIVFTLLVSGTASILAWCFRAIASMISMILGIKRFNHPDWVDRIRSPFRRWHSLTTVLESVMEKAVSKKKLSDCVRHGIDVIFNSCEMRTGTAFRFSNRGSFSWRYGWVVGDDTTVAHAVSASAAYPVIFPAHDDIYQFRKDGEVVSKNRRTVIADGGIYENLGITALEPGQSPKFRVTQVNPDVIICCDAGAGQFGDYVIPYGWGSRMKRAFESTFRKVQDGAKRRLHAYAENGDLKAFIYAYLGQIDERLPCLPADLVSRESVMGYPTDFSAMEDECITLLANRGEILTRYLISRYFPDDRN